jgi:hypothetical protein
MLEHDPEKACPGFVRGETGFAKRSCRAEKIRSAKSLQSEEIALQGQP